MPAAFRRLMTSEVAWGEEADDEEDGEEGEGKGPWQQNTGADLSTVDGANELDSRGGGGLAAAMMMGSGRANAYRAQYNRRAATSLLLMMAASGVPSSLVSTATSATPSGIRTSQRSASSNRRDLSNGSIDGGIGGAAGPSAPRLAEGTAVGGDQYLAHKKSNLSVGKVVLSAGQVMLTGPYK